jgi:hypothetical protein
MGRESTFRRPGEGRDPYAAADLMMARWWTALFQQRRWWLWASAFAGATLTESPDGMADGSRPGQNLFARYPQRLAFTLAPHLQIINHRGRFRGFAGI